MSDSVPHDGAPREAVDGSRGREDAASRSADMPIEETVEREMERIRKMFEDSANSQDVPYDLQDVQQDPEPGAHADEAPMQQHQVTGPPALGEIDPSFQSEPNFEPAVLEINEYIAQQIAAATAAANASQGFESSYNDESAVGSPPALPAQLPASDEASDPANGQQEPTETESMLPSTGINHDFELPPLEGTDGDYMDPFEAMARESLSSAYAQLIGQPLSYEALQHSFLDESALSSYYPHAESSAAAARRDRGRSSKAKGDGSRAGGVSSDDLRSEGIVSRKRKRIESAAGTETATTATDDDEEPRIRRETSAGVIEVKPRIDATGRRTYPNQFVPISEETGKRMNVRGRIDQLSKAIRFKIRQSLGIKENDPLPGPNEGGPNWLLSPRDPVSVAWHFKIADMAYYDLTHGGLTQFDVPKDQRTLQYCRIAARTAFLNYAKRYALQIDNTAKKVHVKDNKRGRRWMRKDLKMKKRNKAVATMTDVQVPQKILRMDYMSSECSSEGENSGLLPGEWDRAADMTGRADRNEKVLEIRSPRWRSDELNAIYDRIDAVAAIQTMEIKGKGHAAAPLRRFKLNPLREKDPPADADEPWMFVDGVVIKPRGKPKKRKTVAKRNVEPSETEQPLVKVEPAGDRDDKSGVARRTAG